MTRRPSIGDAAATRPVQLSGSQHTGGRRRVGRRIGAANRGDPQHFPDPERFDIRRDNAREHLPFGSDLTTASAPLTRLEGPVLVFEELTTTYSS